jgi:hypothetical protein
MSPRQYVDAAVQAVPEDQAAAPEDQGVVIRFWRDGSIDFADPAVQSEYEYELAYAAMGGRKSYLMRIQEDWESQPIWMLGSTIRGTKIAVRLAADYIRHVLHFYLKTYPSDSRPKQYLKILRDYYNSKGPPRQDFRGAALEADDLKYEVSKDVDGNYAATCVARAISMAMENTAIGKMNYADVAESTSVVPANATKLRPRSQQDQEQLKAMVHQERLWQIRRFIDVVGAHQDGLRVPRLRETS